MTASSPSSMYGITIAEPGSAQMMQWEKMPCPSPEADEVLIKVEAAGVNRLDILQRKGFYPPPPGSSPVLGVEVAGKIAALGKNVSQFKIGDAVCALIGGGGYAQYCVAAAGTCLAIPAGLSFIEAASLPETYATVWFNLFDKAGLKYPETVLVQGGSSGIGVSAISLCHALGITIYVTAGSDEKCRACEKLGATKAINYKSEDFAEVIMRLSNNRGVDVILDMVGGSYVPKELSILACKGRLVFISASAGTNVAVDLKEVIAKELTIMGSSLRPQPLAVKTAIMHSLEKTVWPLLQKGTIKAVVYKTFPIKQAADAHLLMESSKHIGKIILSIT